jgi:hypothetical protein
MVDIVPTKWMKTIIVYILLLLIYDRVEIQIPHIWPSYMVISKGCSEEKEL